MIFVASEKKILRRKNGSMCIKNQLSRQTGSRNQTGPKTLPTIWGTYMKLVTKYQISAIKLLRKIGQERKKNIPT
jgi:hypothetical protein